MTTLWQDVAYGLRLLMRRRGLSIATITCLGLGIGVATTVFSVINGALLRPFPYEEPDLLASIWEESKEDPLSASGKRISHPNFFDCRKSSRVFKDMALIGQTIYTMRHLDVSESAQALEVTSNLLELLGMQPVLGRPFLPGNGQKEHQQVAILTHSFWRKWFRSDPNIIGTSIILRSFVSGDQSYIIIGVMPAEFIQPVSPMVKADLLIPLHLEELGAHRDYRQYKAVGRLREGMSIEQAQAELTVIGRRLADEYPGDNHGLQLVTKDLRAEYSGDKRHVLCFLFGASGLLLVVACANVADLLLIQGLERRRELAVRVALGAGRLRMLRQLVVEGLLLSLLGAPVGLLISMWGLGCLRPMVLATVPVVGALKMDVSMLAFAAASASITGVVFGLVPALQAWQTNLSVALKGKAAHATAGLQTRRIHAMLVALQMALTFTLIVGASLAGRTFYNLLRIDPGFNPRNVLTMEIELPRGHYDYKRIDAFHENLLMRIRQLPGVIAASTSDGLPLLDQGSHFLFQVEGGAAQSSNGYDAYSSWVSTGYFHTLGVPLLVGRDFDETDRNHPVLIVNRTLARQLGAAQDVIGKRLQPNGGDDSYEIIGVVEDECYRASQLTGKLDISPRTYFLRYSSGHVNLALRVKTDPQSLAPTARTVIRDMDSQLVIRGVRLMDDVFRQGQRAL